ncbi:hypothetical protein C474_02336 [Halogeometricum pallidum JCM 14848]|uniref:Permease n=1 Tax=Halogeometricum pallidum JCM 14848 TaxID=1227487 RepID=M0DGB0_HALPD|nr:AI-2E family transporter [Halogeometricum pallidum]ELZ34506.1 hypothetical protein C474_02336 [Halogeometricum pallidum JCM 14848]
MNAGRAAAIDRRRVGWWLVAAVVAGIVGLFVFSFVGTFVLGLFVYYGARPVNRRIQRWIDSRGLAATVTLLFIVVPTLALLGYAGFVALRELTATLDSGTVTLLLNHLPGDQQTLADVVQNFPQFVRQLGEISQFQQALGTLAGVLGAVTTGLLHLTLALAFAFFLYRDGHRLQAWYRETVGGRDTAAYAFLAGIDADLEVVYFGNVLTVLAVTLGSMAIYNGYNFLAPGPVSLPFPTLLAILTGLSTFVPLVVGKLVYVPATAYLALRAVQADGSLLVYPVGFLVVVFLLLDILPQSIVRPYISGQTMHEGAVLFAYILGTALFGWYGLFLGPLLLVVVVQFANFVLEDLLWGRPFSAAPTDTTNLGTDPTEMKATTADAATDEGPAPSDDSADGHESGGERENASEGDRGV